MLSLLSALFGNHRKNSQCADSKEQKEGKNGKD